LARFLLAQRAIARLGTEPTIGPTEAGGEVVDALVNAFYASEHQRRQRLEDKLNGLFGYVAFLIPLAIAGLGIGIRNHGTLVVVLAVASLTYLLPVVWLALIGSRDRQVVMVTVDLLDELAKMTPAEQADRVREEKLEAIASNYPISWELNNASSAARGSLAWGLLFLGLVVGLTAASHAPLA
jgi:hypothetical protein